jgi:hypothetical protein
VTQTCNQRFFDSENVQKPGILGSLVLKMLKKLGIRRSLIMKMIRKLGIRGSFDFENFQKLRTGGYEQNQRTAKDIAHLPYGCSSSYQSGDNLGRDMLVGIYYYLQYFNKIASQEKKKKGRL